MAKQTFTVGQVLTAAQLSSLQATALGGGAASAKTASYTLVAADAGTTISMTSTSATTITVNTGLFAAGDTVFIQNLGSGNCTVTAGSATVSTAGSAILPTNDAGILYFVSTGVAIFYDFIQTGAVSPLTTKGDLYTFSTSDARLGVGTNTHVLTADSAEATGLKWAAPASSGFVGVRLTKSAVQSCANNTGVKITWDTETYDTNTFHDPSTNTSRITIPAGKAGYYSISATGAFAANATGQRYYAYYINGVFTTIFGRMNGYSAGDTTLCGTLVFNLAVGDYIEVEAFQNCGVALDFQSTTNSQFSAQFLGA